MDNDGEEEANKTTRGMRGGILTSPRCSTIWTAALLMLIFLSVIDRGRREYSAVVRLYRNSAKWPGEEDVSESSV